MARFQGDLPERSFQYALSILEVVRDIPDGTIGWAVGKQLCRAGTSIGANVAEADGALTNAEFTSICNVGRREAAETGYWLRICAESGLLSDRDLTAEIQEARELHNILATIVRKSQTATKT